MWYTKSVLIRPLFLFAEEKKAKKFKKKQFLKYFLYMKQNVLNPSTHRRRTIFTFNKISFNIINK